jgi:hypothetical protein
MELRNSIRIILREFVYMKTITVGDGYKSLDEFLSIFDETTNIKDVYLTCYQSGCPVYVIRNLENKIFIQWHPSKIDNDNYFKMKIDEYGRLILFTEDIDNIELPFSPIEDYYKDLLVKTLLGKDNVFDEKYKVWERKNENNMKIEVKVDKDFNLNTFGIKNPDINTLNNKIKNMVKTDYLGS